MRFIECKLVDYKLKIYENRNILKQVIFDINGDEIEISFDEDIVNFHEKRDSVLYSLFQRIYNNIDNILDKCVNRIMEGNYSDIPDNFKTLINKFKNIGLKDKILYKYYSSKAVYDERDDGEVQRRIKEGIVTFSAPKNLNDPFECTLFSVDSMKSNINEDYFRVFTCVNDFDNEKHSGVENILMWAHYGDSFKGYCFQYNYSNIIDALYKRNFDSNLIVVSGNVHYAEKPENVGLYPFRDTSFQRTINNIFNKYDIWSYENEYRIALISDSFSRCNNQNILKDEYLKIDNVEYYKVFIGANNKSLNKKDFKCEQFYKVDADKKSCKLRIKEIE